MTDQSVTLGVFERCIRDLAAVVHEAGGLLYYDGANLNAILGRTLPSAMGFDVVHVNLHKTFSTPHGGGGPGAGIVAVTSRLEPFLPIPIVGQRDDDLCGSPRVTSPGASAIVGLHGQRWNSAPKPTCNEVLGSEAAPRYRVTPPERQLPHGETPGGRF